MTETRVSSATGEFVIGFERRFVMIGAGLASAIMNPLHAEDRQAVLSADVAMGRDPNCAAWIRWNRQASTDDEAAAERREGGRRRART
jgi:5-methyltetrahydrofolate--homocysteine methyltransferase